MHTGLTLRRSAASRLLNKITCHSAQRAPPPLSQQAPTCIPTSAVLADQETSCRPGKITKFTIIWCAYNNCIICHISLSFRATKCLVYIHKCGSWIITTLRLRSIYLFSRPHTWFARRLFIVVIVVIIVLVLTNWFVYSSCCLLWLGCLISPW